MRSGDLPPACLEALGHGTFLPQTERGSPNSDRPFTQWVPGRTSCLDEALLRCKAHSAVAFRTTVNVVATQPITQLFAVRQLVKIADADENIARTKAGMPVTTITRHVEKDFFDLLVAERELAAAASDARKVRTSWAAVGDAGLLSTGAQQTDALRVERTQTAVAGEVARLTAALIGLLGLAPDTRLELVPPAPLVEKLTLQDALAQVRHRLHLK